MAVPVNTGGVVYVSL